MAAEHVLWAWAAAFYVHSCEDVDCRKGPHLRYDINIKKDGVCDISVIK